MLGYWCTEVPVSWGTWVPGSLSPGVPVILGYLSTGVPAPPLPRLLQTLPSCHKTIQRAEVASVLLCSIRFSFACGFSQITGKKQDFPWRFSVFSALHTWEARLLVPFSKQGRSHLHQRLEFCDTENLEIFLEFNKGGGFEKNQSLLLQCRKQFQPPILCVALLLRGLPQILLAM